MTKARRWYLWLGLCIAICLSVGPAAAQDYPTKPVRIVCAFGPGASGDVVSRILANKLSAILGQQFYVENRPGAGGIIATEHVVRAEPNGYSLLMASTPDAVNATLSANLPYTFAKDVAPVALVATVPLVLAVHPSLPVNNVQELIALAKAKPEQIFFGSAGVGTSMHLSGELFNQLAGVKLVHVPYKQGSAQAVNDLLAGHVSVMFAPASSVIAQVRAGKLRGLASTVTKRPSIAPDLPTVAESGLPGFDAGIWFGLVAAVNEALKSKEVVSQLQAQGVDSLGGSPEEFARFIRDDTERWAKVVRQAGLAK
jgi:tripartite-type tricarboxylate transporter receptor subunit TctC